MLIDLTDEKTFAGNGFWEDLAWLRENDPVHWHPQPDGPGFWAVTRHADALGVYLDWETFSSRNGMRLDTNPAAVAAVTQRMLIVSDPPDHSQLKRVLAKGFSPAEIPHAEDLVRRVVRELLAEALREREIDLVDLARRVPTRVVCALMGVPREEWDWLGGTMNAAFEGEDEASRRAAHAEIFLYFSELVTTRREEPGDDFVSRIAHDRRSTSVPGETRLLSDEEIVVNCNGVLAGGNETTRYSAGGAVLALLQNPAEWEKLRAWGRPIPPSAIEEVLRWTTPGVHVLRTATRPTRIAGTDIAAGDRVTVWNVSANRDETAFDAPERFDLTRTPNKHLTFGGGRHQCLGARLARLELTVFLEELVAGVEAIEPTGEPGYTASNFTWGVRHLPVRLTPAR
ncbi:cytochrome P450 [Amycolatopsis sp. PS_44_ISF1]|uniref:cytochrome P450 n=1 Tax=Amycolatopsis sp. PS_44_ISF1 TaxID=2974917 RepID=UPI0028DD5687|nr:cytochrome P450 [Amycolatopsis sp. PS_44_ISF1]MDT8909436.1 cytochrome P450 [Amycolatopsis sp. PS_44_ISF1]